MTRRPIFRIVLILVLVLVVVGAAAFAYIWSTGSDQPSSALNAPTLEPQAAGDGRTALYIQPEESQVRFIINEDLFGNPTTVVGQTDQVAGQLLIDFANPSNSEIGTIRVNMRTLATDNEFRNRALRSQILQTSEYEFAEFAPQEITGMPEQVTLGEAFEAQIVGTLTVRNVSREVTFDSTITPVSETRLEGSARTQVLYPDFELSIPNAPGVANVTDEVQLELDFVATDAPLAEATAEAA